MGLIICSPCRRHPSLGSSWRVRRLAHEEDGVELASIPATVTSGSQLEQSQTPNYQSYIDAQSTVANRPRFGCHSPVRKRVQLGRSQVARWQGGRVIQVYI
jgi:hypothetical protein